MFGRFAQRFYSNGRFAQRFYSTESPATESPELLQMVGATAKQFNEYAGFIASVSVIGGGAIQLTKMTKDQMKEVVKPIEEKVDKNSVEIKSVNQKLEKMESQVNEKLEKMQSQFCQLLKISDILKQN